MTEATQRQGRKAQTAQRRRRRDDTSFGAPLKLAVPPEIAAKMAKEGRSVRWVNDTGNRMHRLTKLDDWDKVAGVDPVAVGTGEDSKPILAHLCSKPDAFIEEDRQKAEKRRRTVEAGMIKGKTLVKTDEGEILAPIQGHKGAEIYVDKATSIGRGNQILE
jgi:sarcosine oxidase gamma subunit